MQDDETLGPVGYYAQITNVCAPPGLPGTPIVFAFPDDALKDFKLPYILVRRDDIASAMERWQPTATQYRAPTPGALPVSVTVGTTVLEGFDRMERLDQADPYDIMYTISIKAKFRGASGNRGTVNALFNHVLRTFPTYGKVDVKDSIGDWRGYEAFNEGIANLDVVNDIQDRELGFAITLRVEGELDLKDPVTRKTVKQPLTIRTNRL